MLSERLRELLAVRGISKEDFAEMCDLPIETVRNIYYGKTPDPKLSTMLKMSKALDISVNCLVGQCTHSPEERALLQYYKSCGNHGKSLIALTAKYEALTAKAEREAKEKHLIPCLIPQGNIRQGIAFEQCETVEIYTSNMEAFTAIRMINNDLVPFCCKDDVILIANRFPAHNEYAVFYKEGRAYIRKFLEEDNQYRLKCLHNEGTDIICKRMDEIEYVGTCCGIVRT